MDQEKMDRENGISIFRRGLRQATAGALAFAMLPLSLGSALGQEPYPAQGGPEQGGGAPYQALAPEQIDSLVAPIALYPDSLVAQVLAASTYPQQVVSAQQFLQANGGQPPAQLGELANQQPWDPSVKALVAFPQVVNDLNKNLEWTTQLGNAYYNQPQDVLSAVQTMRQRAYAAGNLRSNPRLNVEYQPNNIVIVPASPEVVYVPYYNPWVVYGAPVVAYPHYYYGPPSGVVFGAGLALGFGVGLAIGAFSHYGWGFHNWGSNWGSRTIVYNHNTYISHSTTVINRGNYGGYDRNPQARAFNHSENVRYGGGNRTINNVTINRGGNTTINRGGNTFNNGGNTVNRGGQTYNRGGQTLNRGGQTYNNGANTVNRGGQTYNRGTQGGTTFPTRQTGTQQQYGRPNTGGQGGFQPQAARPAGGFGGAQQVGRLSASQAAPVQQQHQAAPQQQQRSAPAQENRGAGGGGHEAHGGGGGEHGGGHH